jgi:hypothetical protein
MMTSKGLLNLIKNFECLVKLGILFFLCTATVQAYQATLSWDASAESTPVGYRVHYGQASGNYSSSIDVGLQTTHTISNLQDGTYYFAATSYDVDKIESRFSNEVSKNFTATNPPLPSPWLDMDIGNVGLTGKASFTDKTYTLSGSGADIWGITDAFHFVYQPLNGNGTIIARVVSITNTNSWAKAGVMIRENLDANARHAMVVVTSQNGVSFQRRLTTNANSSLTAGASAKAPYWVKLVRTRNLFNAYQSADGIKWIAISKSVTINMATSVYIGLAVTSHDNGTLNIAKFDNVSVYSN